MADSRQKSVLLVLIAALLVVIAALAGCVENRDTPPVPIPVEMSAKEAFEVARSSLSTTAPDAKLIIVTTSGVVEPTGTPTWQFLMGSPETNLTYSVIVDNGRAAVTPYTASTLTEEDWAAVPDVSEWRIDSDVAYREALTAYPSGDNDEYVMNMLTYLPSAAAAEGTRPLVWFITFDSGARGEAATSTVEVDAVTGEVSIPEE